MDGSLVLRDISLILKDIIQNNIEELKADNAIVFESPGQFEPNNNNCLILYLYNLGYNPYLRNTPPAIIQRNGVFEEVPAPAVMDLRYIMIPYAKLAETELVIVDKLVRLFHNIASLTDCWLTPLLKQTDNKDVRIVPDQPDLNLIHNFWTSFPGKASKLSLFYLLSPVRIPSMLSKAVDRIYQTNVNYTVES